MVNFFGWYGDDKFVYVPKTGEIFDNMNDLRKHYGQSVAKNMWKNKEVWFCCKSKTRVKSGFTYEELIEMNNKKEENNN